MLMLMLMLMLHRRHLVVCLDGGSMMLKSRCCGD
jgi:hypothetical protein